MKSIEQLHQFFGEDVPFSTYLYDVHTGSIALGEATTLILKKNVPDIEEDEIFIFNRVKKEQLLIKSSELQVIFEKDTLIVLRYKDIVLFCLAEAAELFKSLMKRQEAERYHAVREVMANA